MKSGIFNTDNNWLSVLRKNSIREGVNFWRKTAEQGLAKAQHNLGIKYQEGNGIPENDKEAVRWYMKAAEQGLADAQAARGYAYEFGNGVIENYIQAYAWYNIAQANGDENAKERKAIVAKEMTKEQIAEAQDLSPCKPLK